MLPLDLHVLSLSLAFILSQDQTLRCSNCFMSLLKIPLFPGSSILLTVFILNTCTTVVYVNFSKNSSQSFLSKRGAKVRIFIFIFQIFFEVFSIYFFGSFFRNGFRTFAWIFQPHPSVSIFPGFLTPLSSCHHRISLDCGCKSTAVKHIFQMFFQLFYNYFLLSLIVKVLQIHFYSFFYFPPFLFYFTFPNFQLSILKKLAYFYQFAPAFQQKTPAFSLFMPIFLKQLNENRFQSSLDLFSILV